MTVEPYQPGAGTIISTTGPYRIEWPYVVGAVRALVQDGLTWTELVDTDDFTVHPEASIADGALTLTAAALTAHAGKTLHIRRQTGAEQGWAALNAGRETALERQLDRNTMRLQELGEDMARTLRLPVDLAEQPLTPGRIMVTDAEGLPYPGPDAQEVLDAAALALATRDFIEQSITSNIAVVNLGPFTGDGVTTTWPAPWVSQAAQVHLYLDGVAQSPDTFTVGSHEITLDAAPVEGTRIFGRIMLTGAMGATSAENVALPSGETMQAWIDRNGSFATRASLLAALAWPWTVGAVVTAGDIKYRYTGSGTTIADMPGWVPFGTATPQHYGAKADGVNNDRAAVEAWMLNGGGFAPAGHYLIPGPRITLNVDTMKSDNLIIEGAGFATLFENSTATTSNRIISISGTVEATERPILSFDEIDGLSRLLMSDAGDLAADDYIRVQSLDYFDGLESLYTGYLGELAQVKEVDGNYVTLKKPLVDIYSTSPVVVRYKPVVQPIVKNIRIKGRGNGATSSEDQSAVYFDFCVAPVASGVTIEACQKNGVTFNDCDGFIAENNTVTYLPERNSVHIMYGIAWLGFSSSGRILGNTILNGRHAIAHSESAFTPGTSHDVIVSGNRCDGAYAAAIATHLRARTIVISDNITRNCGAAFDIRTRGVTISGNIAEDCVEWMVLRNLVGDLVASGNISRRTVTRLLRIDEVYDGSAPSNIRFTGNQLKSLNEGMIFDWAGYYILKMDGPISVSSGATINQGSAGGAVSGTEVHGTVPYGDDQQTIRVETGQSVSGAWAVGQPIYANNIYVGANIASIERNAIEAKNLVIEGNTIEVLSTKNAIDLLGLWSNSRIRQNSFPGASVATRIHGAIAAVYSDNDLAETLGLQVSFRRVTSSDTGVFSAPVRFPTGIASNNTGNKSESNRGHVNIITNAPGFLIGGYNTDLKFRDVAIRSDGSPARKVAVAYSDYVTLIAESGVADSVVQIAGFAAGVAASGQYPTVLMQAGYGQKVTLRAAEGHTITLVHGGVNGNLSLGGSNIVLSGDKTVTLVLNKGPVIGGAYNACIWTVA